MRRSVGKTLSSWNSDVYDFDDDQLLHDAKRAPSIDLDSFDLKKAKGASSSNKKRKSNDPPPLSLSLSMELDDELIASPTAAVAASSVSTTYPTLGTGSASSSQTSLSGSLTDFMLNYPQTNPSTSAMLKLKKENKENDPSSGSLDFQNNARKPKQELSKSSTNLATSMNSIAPSLFIHEQHQNQQQPQYHHQQQNYIKNLGVLSSVARFVLGSKSTVFYVHSAFAADFQSFAIQITDGSDIWQGDASESYVRERLVPAGMDISDYVQLTQEALFHQDTTRSRFSYSLAQGKRVNTQVFSWSIRLVDQDQSEDQISMVGDVSIKGALELQKAKDARSALSLVLDCAIHRRTMTEFQNVKLSAENSELSSQRQRALATFESLIKEKSAMENELYQKFSLVLNAKKKKIREMRETINQLESELQSRRRSPSPASVKKKPAQKRKTKKTTSSRKLFDKEEEDDSSSDDDLLPTKSSSKTTSKSSQKQQSLSLSLMDQPIEPIKPLSRQKRKMLLENSNTDASNTSTANSAPATGDEDEERLVRKSKKTEEEPKEDTSFVATTSKSTSKSALFATSKTVDTTENPPPQVVPSSPKLLSKLNVRRGPKLLRSAAIGAGIATTAAGKATPYSPFVPPAPISPKRSVPISPSKKKLFTSYDDVDDLIEMAN